MEPVREYSPREVRERLSAGEDVLLLDCREAEELSLARIEGARHIPMGEIPVRLGQIDADREVIVFCHRGVRSLHVALWLREAGLEQVATMAGGIDAWSAEVDPEVPRY